MGNYLAVAAVSEQKSVVVLAKIAFLNRVAPTGLFAFEYTLTFSHEVNLFWRRKFTLSSTLFFLNRYAPFAVNMIYVPWPSPPATLQVSAG